MLKNLITESLFASIVSQFKLHEIEEVRLRANCPIVVCSLGKNYILKSNLATYFLASDYELNYIISKATQNSLYAVNDNLKQMFLSFAGGIRIGVTGDIVVQEGQVKTIKHINSINIRIPHQVKDFSNIALNFIKTGSKINSTLVVSSPGGGKTTMLRDICRGINLGNDIKNVLLVDERYEIACCVNGRPLLNVGLFTDIISGGSKNNAFLNGIRALKPDVIITDELASDADLIAVENAVSSGVTVIASVHADNQLDLLKKPKIKDLLSKGIFTRIVVLSSDVPNRYVGIYDNNLKCLYMPY